MSQSEIGLVGLAVMGENLVLNMESKGFSVSVFNRTTSKVTRFVEGRAKGKNVTGALMPEEFVQSLAKPRKINLESLGAEVDAIVFGEGNREQSN